MNISSQRPFFICSYECFISNTFLSWQLWPFRLKYLYFLTVIDVSRQNTLFLDVYKHFTSKPDRRRSLPSSVSSMILIQIDTSSAQNSNRLICEKPQYSLRIFHIHALLLSWNTPCLFHRHWWSKCGFVHGKLAGSSICLCGTSGGSSNEVSKFCECWSVISFKRRYSSLSERTLFSRGSV